MKKILLIVLFAFLAANSSCAFAREIEVFSDNDVKSQGIREFEAKRKWHPKVRKALKQPEKTLTVEGSIVEFTIIKIFPKGKSVAINQIEVERTGLGDNAAFKKIILIAKKSPGLDELEEDRVIAEGFLDQNGLVYFADILTFFDKSKEIVVAGVMADDLSPFPGQENYLTVNKVRLVKENRIIDAKGQFPLSGTGQVVSSNLQIGKISISFDSYNGITLQSRGFAEDVRVEKIFFQKCNNCRDFLVNYDGQDYEGAITDSYTAVDFGKGIILKPKSSITLTLSRGSGEDFLQSPYGLVAKGETYGYRIAPYFD